MPKRYARAPRINGGRSYGTYTASRIINKAVKSNAIEVATHTTVEGERLDIIAGRFYGDGNLWWVIAAASGIGWGLQIPPGTYLIIPTDLGQIEALVG